MTLTAALTYGYDLGGPDKWNIRELDSDGQPRLFWYSGGDFSVEATQVLEAANVNVDLVPYGDKQSGNCGYILASSADIEAGPISRPWAVASIATANLVEHNARLASALDALGITPTQLSFARTVAAKPGWITSAYRP